MHMLCKKKSVRTFRRAGSFLLLWFLSVVQGTVSTMPFAKRCALLLVTHPQCCCDEKALLLSLVLERITEVFHLC